MEKIIDWHKIVKVYLFTQTITDSRFKFSKYYVKFDLNK